MSGASDVAKVAEVLLPIAASLAEPLVELIEQAGKNPDSPEAKAAYVRFGIAAKRAALKKARGG